MTTTKSKSVKVKKLKQKKMKGGKVGAMKATKISSAIAGYYSTKIKHK